MAEVRSWSLTHT